MSKLADEMTAYIQTGSLRGLSLVQTRDALRMHQLDNDRALSEDEIKTLSTLDALLSSEPPARIRRAREGHR